MTLKGKPFEWVTCDDRDIGQFDKNGYMEVNNELYIARMKNAGFQEVKLFECECGKIFEKHTSRLNHWKTCKVHKAKTEKKKASEKKVKK